MHNKQSCRECGAFLTPHAFCTVCKEHTSWVCGQCGRIDDCTHVHNYCRVAYDEKGEITVRAG